MRHFSKLFVLVALGCLGTLYAFQKPFRVYRSLEPYDDINIPVDWDEKTELVFARLMFPSHPYAKFERPFSNWREGGTGWSEDYPRADRHFARDRKSTRLNSSHPRLSRMPSSA